MGELAKGERSSNGFIDRILFVMPNLQQKPRWNDKELPADIEQEWHAIIDKFIQLECNYNEQGEVEPYILHFDEDTVFQNYATVKGMTRLSAFIASWKYTSSVSV